MDSTRVLNPVFPREPSSSTWPPVAPAPSLTIAQLAGVWGEDDPMRTRRCSADVRSEWSIPGWLWSVANAQQIPRTPALVTELGQEYLTPRRPGLSPPYQTWTPGADWLWADTLPSVQQGVASWQSQTQQEYRVRARPTMEPYRWWQPERTDWLYGPATAALPAQWAAMDGLVRSEGPGRGRQSWYVQEWDLGTDWIVATFPPTFDVRLSPRLPDTPWLWKPGRWPTTEDRSGVTLIMLPPGLGVWNAPDTFVRTPGRAILRYERLTSVEVFGIPQTLAGYIPFDAAMEQLARSEYRLRQGPEFNIRLYEWSPELGWITTLIPTPPVTATKADFLLWMRRRRR